MARFGCNYSIVDVTCIPCIPHRVDIEMIVNSKGEAQPFALATAKKMKDHRRCVHITATYWLPTIRLCDVFYLLHIHGHGQKNFDSNVY